MVGVLPPNHARDIRSPCTHRGKGRFAAPWHRELDSEIPISTCTEPWPNVRRSIALKGASTLPGDHARPKLKLRSTNASDYEILSTTNG
jgi:hypothetical protein